MLRFVRHTALALVSTAYLTASCSMLILRITAPCGSSGPERVEPVSGATKEQPRPAWTMRRHMPMVKESSVPLATTTRGQLPEDIRTFETVPAASCVFPHSDLYFSSLADRAPPAA